MDRRSLKLSLFRELDEKFIEFEEVAEVFRWQTTGCLVQTEVRLTIPINIPGSILSFNFDTKFGDIAFGITFVSQEDKDVESVVDLNRIRSDLESIEGTFEVPRIGVINLLWDNSFSWLTAKSLAYSVVLHQGVAISSADTARIASARDIALKIHEDDVKSKLRYDEESARGIALTEELGPLEKQLAELMTIVKKKKNELQESIEIAERAMERMIINYETKPGLFLRYLSRNDLSRVFSYLYDDKGVGLVCKYWLATIVGDITASPPTGRCLYSVNSLKKRTRRGSSNSIDAHTNGHEAQSTSNAPTEEPSVAEDEEESGDCDSDLGQDTLDVTERQRRQEIQINDIRRGAGKSSDGARDVFVHSSASSDSHDTDKQPVDTLRWRQRRVVLRRTELRREAMVLEEELNELRGRIQEQTAQRRRVRSDIMQWKADFTELHGRRPTDEEKEAGAKPWYLEHNQCVYLLGKIEAQYLKIYENFQAKQREIKRCTLGSEE